MNGNNVYIPHSQTENSLGHTTPMDPVFFDNTLPQIDTVQPGVVSIYL